MTFADIEKLHFSELNSGRDVDDFKPSDIIDEENLGLESEDEIL